MLRQLTEILWMFSFLPCFLHDIPTSSSHFNNENLSMLYATDVQDLTLCEEFPSESWIYFSSSGEIYGSCSGPLFTTFHQMKNQTSTAVPETMICSVALVVIFRSKFCRCVTCKAQPGSHEEKPSIRNITREKSKEYKCILYVWTAKIFFLEVVEEYSQFSKEQEARKFFFQTYCL